MKNKFLFFILGILTMMFIYGFTQTSPVSKTKDTNSNNNNTATSGNSISTTTSKPLMKANSNKTSEIDSLKAAITEIKSQVGDIKSQLDEIQSTVQNIKSDTKNINDDNQAESKVMGGFITDMEDMKMTVDTMTESQEAIKSSVENVEKRITR